MRISSIVATTEPVKRGEEFAKLTLEALEENVSTAAGLPIIHKHNPLFLPIGKTEQAWIERFSESEGAFHQQSYVITDEPDRFVHELSKTRCVHIPFRDSPSKFALGPQQVGNSVTIDISSISHENYEILKQEVHDFDAHVTLGLHDRQQEIPIPLIQFVSDLSLAETLFIATKLAILGAAVTGKLAKWVEDTVKWIKNECVPVVGMYRRHKTVEAVSRRDEWLEFKFDLREFNGPLIELVIPSEHDSEIPETFVEKLAEQVSMYCDLLADCDKIVFAYRPTEETCELRYALTKKGGVIGTEECYEESIGPHRQWVATIQQRTDVWWTLSTMNDGELAIQLYKLGGDQPEHLGFLSMDPDSATKFLEVFSADDGILRPFRTGEDDLQQ